MDCRGERWAIDGRRAKGRAFLNLSIQSRRVMPGMILCYRPSSHSLKLHVCAVYRLLFTACIYPLCFRSPWSFLVGAYTVICVVCLFRFFGTYSRLDLLRICRGLAAGQHEQHEHARRREEPHTFLNRPVSHRAEALQNVERKVPRYSPRL